MERERSTTACHDGEPGTWSDNEESCIGFRCGDAAHVSIQPPTGVTPVTTAGHGAETSGRALGCPIGENGKSVGKREGGRAILHVDMDAFFASIEQLYNPRLRGIPVLVCGDPDGRSVVATASYEARPFGIRCGMPVGQAKRLCPHATLVEGDPGKYIHVSVEVLRILRTFTQRVEPFSVDEAFVEVTGMVARREELLGLAARVQRKVREGTGGLTASIGMGPNKFIAKMASGVRKPAGMTCFSKTEFRRHFFPQPVRELWGVGEATERSLNALGIFTVADLARAGDAGMSRAFGVVGPSLIRVARGEDESPLVSVEESPDAKSIGHEHTLDHDEGDPTRLLAHLLRLSDMVGRRARLHGFAGSVVSIRLRDSNFTTRQMQKKLSQWVNDGLSIFRIVEALYRKLHRGGRLRLVGVSLGGLARMAPDPQQLLLPEDVRNRKLMEALDALKGKLGEETLVRAGALLCRGGPGLVPFHSPHLKEF